MTITKDVVGRVKRMYLRLTSSMRALLLGLVSNVLELRSHWPRHFPTSMTILGALTATYHSQVTKNPDTPQPTDSKALLATSKGCQRHIEIIISVRILL